MTALPSPGLAADLSRERGRGADGIAPILVLAVGNLSRGDDAVGPLLAERLQTAALPGVEVLVDFQLQVEHALDVADRARVIFIDACVDVERPFVVRELTADARFTHTSHALMPSQVLETHRRITGEPTPPAYLLGIRASCFELGAVPSTDAERACAAAWPALLQLCGSDPVVTCRT